MYIYAIVRPDVPDMIGSYTAQVSFAFVDHITCLGCSSVELHTLHYGIIQIGQKEIHDRKMRHPGKTTQHFAEQYRLDNLWLLLTDSGKLDSLVTL